MGAKVKRIRDESEYKSGGGSDFIGLDEGEKFTGYALFVGDPKEDETGFFPYKMHWQNNRSVPCADEDCIYCEDGDRPRSKAYTLWLVIKDESGNELGKPKGSGELRIWDMPVSAIKQFNEFRSEGEKTLGRQFRISRPDEKTYVVMPKTVAPLKSAEVKALLKSDEAPDFEGMLTSKLKKSMEGVAVARAMEDDEDEKPQKAKAKAKAKAKGAKKGKDEEPEDDDDETTATGDWPDELDEEEVTVRSVEDDGNYFIAVSSGYDDEKNVYTNPSIELEFNDLSKGDKITISAELDADGDYVLTAEPSVDPAPDADDDESEADNDLPDAIEDVEMVVQGYDESDSTIEVKNDEMEFTLYLLDTVEIDYDDYKEGTKILVTAEKDRAGDLVSTTAPEVVKAKKAAAKKGAAKGSGKKAAAKKGGKGK